MAPPGPVCLTTHVFGPHLKNRRDSDPGGQARKTFERVSTSAFPILGTGAILQTGSLGGVDWVGVLSSFI